MSKLAIVGCEASGKTVFMSALCDCFRAAIVPENAAANRFARFATRQLRALRQWPPATPPGKAVEMNFSLREGGTSLMDFALLEFGGETFRAAFRDEESDPAHKRAVKDLLDFLGDADFILVLVSLQELFRDPGDTPLDEFERDTESIWVTRGLLEFIRDKAPAAHVLIGLTQADRFAGELAAQGGPAQVFASRWPSIRALAPDLPVVGVASVSATDDEGRPREGFTTDGILPVLREFARAQYGSSVNLHLALAAARQALDAALADPERALLRLTELTKHVKRFGATLDALKAVHALTREPLARETRDALDKLENYTRQIKELRAKLPKRTAPRRKSSHVPRVRRVFLLALLLAAVAFLADTYRPIKSRLSYRPTPPDTHATFPAPGATGVLARCATPAPGTTGVLARCETPTPGATGVLARCKTPAPGTTGVLARCETPAATTNAPPFRIWHDHKGTAIKARWIDTSEDRKSITLETPSGKRLRAVLYKFSEEDRAFVLKALGVGR